MEALHEDLACTATFTPLEDWLTIEVVGEGLGHFLAKCEARDEAGVGNALTFTLSFDQTDVPSILTGLGAIRSIFPVLGEPGG
jgi:hypothetical protein